MGKKVDNTPLEHHWCCEDCGTAHAGVNPPAKCSYCRHEYFDNLADLLKATGPQEHAA